jgi:hypothetical protein
LSFACIHMSGLLVRRAQLAKMVSAAGVPVRGSAGSARRRRGADHQKTAQHRVAGTRDAAGPRLAGGRVIALHALAHQPLTLARQHQGRLLARRLHRDKTHRRPARRLAHCLRIGRIVFAALHVGLGKLRRDQPRIVPERPKLTRPIMRGAASLQSNQSRRRPAEKPNHLAAAQLLAKHRPLRRINTMQLKKTLGRIQADADKLFHGRLLLMSCRQHPSRHIDAAQRPVHPIRSKFCNHRMFCSWIPSLCSQ